MKTIQSQIIKQIKVGWSTPWLVPLEKRSKNYTTVRSNITTAARERVFFELMNIIYVDRKREANLDITAMSERHYSEN